ncbi:MAG: hypothetical protein KKF46_05775 [Nanoarchaeota archaeon]|nr:hypothetical protein [Nanoarchaeota archaeon]MBU1321841.1 hypothetical protein [Nanoarchaeota archaeon]MBU1597186.1 hypothetical protein [Nanoarchaeota archaeon]MBU2441885.1 hypothetical protein [Nanoarchaeota archaeon]
MSNFDELRNEAKKFVRENKEFFDRFSKDIDTLTLGNYIDLYIGSKGISHLNTGSEFDDDYDKALDIFCKQKEQFKEVEYLIVKYLDFLIWLKKQQEIYKTKISERKRLHKHALEFPNTINNIFLNKELAEKDKFEILLFYYCSLQEIFKNIVQEELLLKIWKEGKTDTCDLIKKHIQLGDFIFVIQKYESSTKNKISKIFDVELRNKVLHADYLIEPDKIIYGSKSVTKQDVYQKITQLGITLQFFTLFYLRLFKESD